MSDTFTPFRNIVEKKCQIGNPLPIPGKEDMKIKDIDEIDKCSANYMPNLSDLGYNQQQIHHANTVHERGVMNFIGGETTALARCKEFIWDKDLIKVYFDTRNGLIGPDYSTKFSPWLAHGNISPRYIAKECRNYEEVRVANKSTYWVVFELLVRDYFKFFAKNHGNNIFFLGGTTTGAEKKWGSDKRHITAWKEGRTGFPFVDANMRELAETGFMSNRGRQNVCSFLAHDLNQDWRYGADYFESILLDHDVHSNWGNWCAGAGMTGGRINKFNTVKQSKDYDQHGDYVRRWLPELKDVPIDFLHQPWTMSQFHQIESNCRLGVDYPNPIVSPYNPKQGGGKGSGDNRKRGGRGQKNKNNNRNRGRGQREDMKSLKPGQIIMKD
jgi:deoxyribodipyrimidine photo-lyase